MIKGLFKIPDYEPSEEIQFNTPNLELMNVHGVPAARWAKWDNQAREMFNYLYEAGMLNHEAVYCTDKFRYGPDMEKIIAASAWNMAWLAADKIMGL